MENEKLFNIEEPNKVENLLSDQIKKYRISKPKPILLIKLNKAYVKSIGFDFSKYVQACVKNTKELQDQYNIFFFPVTDETIKDISIEIVSKDKESEYDFESIINKFKKLEEQCLQNQKDKEDSSE